MVEFLGEYFLWIKSIHILAVISWMAGLLYLPRLFVYHTRVTPGSDQDQLFQVMEIKLLRIIMNPAMIAAWLFGLLLIFTPGITDGASGWLYAKMIAVVALSVFHMILGRWRQQFAAGENSRKEKFYRAANEVPTLLMILIVVVVVVKPF
jgi:putative membrane protein